MTMEQLDKPMISKNANERLETPDTGYLGEERLKTPDTGHHLAEERLETPDTGHLAEEQFWSVYEPAEDSFLLLDSLELELARLRQLGPLVGRTGDDGFKIF